MRGPIPPLPQYVFMAWCLVKHRDNFTFTFMSLKDKEVLWLVKCTLSVQNYNKFFFHFHLLALTSTEAQLAGILHLEVQKN
jgi:hypothetical protein